MRYVNFLILIFLIFLIFCFPLIARAEIVELIKEETKEVLTPDEYLKAVEFILQIDKNKVGEFWMTDKDKKTILSLAATYLRTKEIREKKIFKDYRYRLIISREEEKVYDFVTFRKGIPIFILNFNQKGEILIKPKTKLIFSVIIPIEDTEILLQLNMYE